VPRREHRHAEVERQRAPRPRRPVVERALPVAREHDVGHHALHALRELGAALLFERREHAPLGVVRRRAPVDEAAG
jgi:hypothetical protein